MPGVDDDIKLAGKDVSAVKMPEAIGGLAPNKTLLALKLTQNSPSEPEIVHNMKTLDMVFDQYQPNVSVEFENEEGQTLTEEMRFQNIGDFGPNGLIKQSEFLKSLLLKKESLEEFRMQLSKNKAFKTLIEDKEAKQAYLRVLEGLLQELKDAEE